MKVLFLGDVVGDDACEFLMTELPKLRRMHGVDLTLINGENSAEGNGITPYSAQKLLDAGADVITTGNHCFKRREVTSLFEQNERILRPANLGNQVPGAGLCKLDFGSFQVAVINLQGTVYMQAIDNPFHYADKLLEQIDTPVIIVDFHAEATAEKKALGYYLAGRVSAVIGTHTHIQTADESILENHTGYITDAGMTGVQESVLGIEKEIIIRRMTSYFPQKHVFAKGVCVAKGVLLEIEPKTGRCISIQRIS